MLIERPHHADACHHGRAVVLDDQEKGLDGVLPVRLLVLGREGVRRQPEAGYRLTGCDSVGAAEAEWWDGSLREKPGAVAIGSLAENLRNGIRDFCIQ